MKKTYKIEVKVNISKDECEEFEESLKNKEFDFFRFLADNSAKIKIVNIENEN